MFSVQFASVALVLQAGSGDCRLFAQCTSIILACIEKNGR